jgi:hypothetical protein
MQLFLTVLRRYLHRGTEINEITGTGWALVRPFLYIYLFFQNKKKNKLQAQNRKVF